MIEKWINVDDSYEISNFGRLRKGDLIIKPIICKNGYLEYALWKNGKRKVYLVHRLVAKYFIENPNNLPEVNHKDENIKNNNVENLEWCTSKYNANYGTRNLKCRECNRKSFKSIDKYDLNDEFIQRYECIKDAARDVNGDVSAISRVANGKTKTAYGYKWKFNNC